jgi:hypothetical protein
MSTNISLERLLEQTPEDKRYLGEPAQIREEDLEIDENIDTFYDSEENMFYLGDGERVIGLRKRNSAGEEIVATKDIAPVDQYEEIKEREGFAAVVGYAEADDFAGYDPENGFYKSPEEQVPESTVKNRSNAGD